MRNILKIFFLYLFHIYKSRSVKGHGIHSPYLYGFFSHCLNKHTKPNYRIEKLRSETLRSNVKIQVTDYGAGSKVSGNNFRKISKIVSNSTSKKKNLLLSQIASWHQPQIVIELGTSLGFSAAYISTAIKSGKIITVEGCTNIYKVAKSNFQQLGMDHIELINCRFDDFLTEFKIDTQIRYLIYLDGNHTFNATIKYFKYFVEHLDEKSVILIDDINWSDEMRKAWNMIREFSNVTTCIDLFFMGVVFIKSELRKEVISVRY